MNDYRRFSLQVLFTFIALTSLALGVALAIDPAWTMPWDHPLNSRQRGYDERAQKRNLLASRPVQAHMVMLGSSRTTFIDPADFGADRHAFNFAVSGVVPAEYPVLLDYALTHLHGPVTDVALGLDFFGALDDIEQAAPLRMPSLLERGRAHLSFDMLELAVGNAWRSLTDDRMETYDRQGHRFLAHKPAARQDKDFVYELRKLVEYRYRPGNVYNPHLRDILARLPQSWPQLRFRVFTTPVSAAQYEGMVCQGRLADWERWLTDAVAVFGRIHHFMDINPITLDRANWADSHHFYPEVGRMIARQLIGAADDGAPAGFGVVLDAATLAPYLERARARAVDCEGWSRRWKITLANAPR